MPGINEDHSDYPRSWSQPPEKGGFKPSVYPEKPKTRRKWLIFGPRVEVKRKSKQVRSK